MKILCALLLANIGLSFLLVTETYPEAFHLLAGIAAVLFGFSLMLISASAFNNWRR